MEERDPGWPKVLQTFGSLFDLSKSRKSLVRFVIVGSCSAGLARNPCLVYGDAWKSICAQCLANILSALLTGKSYSMYHFAFLPFRRRFSKYSKNNFAHDPRRNRNSFTYLLAMMSFLCNLTHSVNNASSESPSCKTRQREHLLSFS